MLTQRQHQLLMFIQSYLDKHGVPPSFEEMRDALKLKSRSGIHRLITGLEERGYIRRLAYRARQLEITRKLRDELNEAADVEVTEVQGNVVRIFNTETSSRSTSIKSPPTRNKPVHVVQSNENRTNESTDNIWLSLYVSSDSFDSANNLFELTKGFLSELGYDLQVADDWKRGSWFRRAVFSLGKIFKEELIQDRVRLAENLLYGRQSLETSKGLVEATVKLVEALRDQEGNVAIDAGSFIFLKKSSDGDADTVFVKALTVDERALLDKEPSLVSDPEKLFKRIKGMKRVGSELLEAKKRDPRMLPETKRKEPPSIGTDSEPKQLDG